jgi:hypothetical protein
MEKEYKNVGYFLLILFVLVIAGFYESYFGLFPHFNSSITTSIHFHAFVMALYVILLIVQPFLIFYKKFETHRLFGKFSYVLVPIIIFSFFAMIYKEYNDKLLHKISNAEFIEFTFLNIGKLSLFGGFYMFAIINKRNTPFHMRYIIATALVFVEPSLTRAAYSWIGMDFLPSLLFSFLLTDLILISLIIFDKIKHLSYRPYAIALTVFLLYQTIWYIVFYLI